jgi:hypothetical protein
LAAPGFLRLQGTLDRPALMNDDTSSLSNHKRILLAGVKDVASNQGSAHVWTSSKSGRDLS